MDTSSAEYKAAVRAIQRFNEGVAVTPENIRVYLALKQQHARVSPRMMQEAASTREVKQGALVESTFYLVPKANFAAATSAGAPQLPKAARPFEIPPGILADQVVSCDLDLRTYFVVDSACPRAVLGLGVSQIRLQMSTSNRFVQTHAAASGAASDTTEGDTMAVADTSSTAASAAERSTQLLVTLEPPTKKRALTRQCSEPQVVTQELLSNMRNAAERGAFVSEDLNDCKTVEFWARLTVRSLCARPRPAAAAGAASAVYDLFPRYLCKLLLESDTYDALPRFVQCFEALDKGGHTLPRTAKFIQQLAAFNPAEDTELDTSSADMSELHHFFNSTLYAGFRERRCSARYLRALAASGVDADSVRLRQRLLEELALARDVPKDIADKVSRARSMFSDKLPLYERWAFALHDKENAELAALWAPEQPIGSLVPFSTVDARPWGSWEGYVAAKEVLQRLKLVEKVKHPVAKQLLTLDIHEALAAALGADQALAFQREVASVRLGVFEWRSQPTRPFDWTAAESSLVTTVHKLVARALPPNKHHPWDQADLPHLSALKKAHDALARDKEADALPKAADADGAGKTVLEEDAVDSGADATGLPELSDAQGAVAPTEAKIEDIAKGSEMAASVKTLGFSEGDIVRVCASRKKDEWGGR